MQLIDRLTSVLAIVVGNPHGSFYSMNGFKLGRRRSRLAFSNSETPCFFVSYFLPQSTPFSNPCVACPSSSEGSPISWRRDPLFSELWRTPADKKMTRRYSPTHWQSPKIRSWQQTTFLGSLTISSEMQSAVPGPLSLKNHWASSTQLDHKCSWPLPKKKAWAPLRRTATTTGHKQQWWWWWKEDDKTA